MKTHVNGYTETYAHPVSGQYKHQLAHVNWANIISWFGFLPICHFAETLKHISMCMSSLLYTNMDIEDWYCFLNAEIS